MVGPAAACGIFGLRPSHGALSNEGALAVSSYVSNIEATQTPFVKTT